MEFISRILCHEELSPGYWKMRLSAPSAFLKAEPGQFVMVKVAEGIEPLLRRPLGIFDVGSLPETETGEEAGEMPVYFELLYHALGRGTRLMARMVVNDLIPVLGPLGTGFRQGRAEEHIIVGGGIGLAPLFMLAKEQAEKKSAVSLLAGGRSASDVLCVSEFERLGLNCTIATDDGSLGEKGLVTDLLVRKLEELAQKRKPGIPETRIACIYACGPQGMLNAVAKIANDYGAECQVSLENYMACGMGACLACVTPAKGHSPETPDYRCVCTEGPVFDAEELLWEGAQ